MSEQKLKGFIYDGTFPLEFLTDSEQVQGFSNHGKGACRIIANAFNDNSTFHPVAVGDCVARGTKGEILVIDTSEQKP